MTSAELILKQVEMGPMMNFIYIIGCAETREGAVVDPAWDVSSILSVAKDLNLRVRHIFITHAHPDHINGLEEMLEKTDATVYLNTEEMAYMHEMGKLFQVSLEFMERHAAKIRPVSDGHEILLGKIPVRAIHTPGHTPGSQCFLVEGNLISGDTLFVDACGRVDFPGGDPAQMWRSLNRKLRDLDDTTILWPGHNYGDRPTSTLGEQKRTNPYMQFASPADFLRSMGVR